MQLLAHRGLRGPGRPENTAEAVSAARQAGADGCEVDLRLSADGVLLAAHDDDLCRVAGVPLRVSATPAARLRALRLPGGTRLALAEELLEAAGGGAMVLELKRCPQLFGVRRTVAAVDRLLRRAPRGLDLTVSSFDPRLVAGVRRLGLPVRTALLGRRRVPPRDVLAEAVLAGHDEVHPHVDVLAADPDAVWLARAHGLDVVGWTVNAPDHGRLLAAVGVRAAITDDPVLLRAALQPAPALGVG